MRSPTAPRLGSKRLGGPLCGADYLTALDLIARCRTRLTAAAAGYDALLVPLLQLAPRGATPGRSRQEPLIV